MFSFNNLFGFVSETVDTLNYSEEEKAALLANQKANETANQTYLSESTNIQNTIITSLIIISGVVLVTFIINKIF